MINKIQMLNKYVITFFTKQNMTNGNNFLTWKL